MSPRRGTPLERIPFAGEASKSTPIEVPFTTLSPAALRSLIESVVLREGTDYGEQERSLEVKADEILARLRRGDARVVFDFESQTADIVQSERRSTDCT